MFDFGMLSGGLGALGSLANMFHKRKNPADSAMVYLNQIPNEMMPYYKSYIDSGMGERNNLQDFYEGLMKDPTANYNKLAAGYTASPGLQRRIQAGLTASDAAQARGGMLGTPQHQEYNADIASNIEGQDFDNYMRTILGQQGFGTSGEQGLENQGYDASTGFANMLGSNLGSKAGYGYTGQAAKNQMFGNNIRDLLSYISRMGTNTNVGGGV